MIIGKIDLINGLKRVKFQYKICETRFTLVG
jgi:hypothetical protein